MYKYVTDSQGGFTRSQKFANLQKLHILANFSNNKGTMKRLVKALFVENRPNYESLVHNIWPKILIKCHCHQRKYVYEGRNACRLCWISSGFNLEIRARSVMYVSDVTNWPLTRKANKARLHHQSVHNESAMQMCSRGMRRAADQRVVVFLSHLPER